MWRSAGRIAGGSTGKRWGDVDVDVIIATIIFVTFIIMFTSKIIPIKNLLTKKYKISKNL